MMNLALSFEMLQAVAIACPDGFTVDKNTFEPITSGYSVAVADTQNSFGNYGAAKVVSYANKHNEIKALGGWYNSKNGQFYYDAVIIVDSLEEALKIGRENNQLAIFDLNNMQEIEL
jgi:fructokinase